MEKKATLAMWAGLISNVFLTVIKIVVGLLFHSQVLIADGVHNAGDVVASLAALSSMKIAHRPADEDHPYGHGKAEVIAAGMVGLILAISALVIAYQSIGCFFRVVSDVHVVAFMAAIISVFWKLSLYQFSMRVGRKANSKSLIATAYDHLADVYASLAAVIGIGLALIGDLYQIPFLRYGDPFSGIIVSVLVLKLALKIGQESIATLMEKNLDEEKIQSYFSIINSVQEVKRVDQIRAREHGYYVMMDVRVSIPANLSIQEGHDVCKKIKQRIMDQDKDVQEVLIHLNPYYERVQQNKLLVKKS
jgi:cation diffusion facilitator family transporter